MATIAVLVIAGCGSGCGSDSSSTADGKAPASTAPAPAKVAPRWEPVTRFSGSGDQRTPGFDIAPHAIQWRVTATCGGQRLEVLLAPEPEPLTAPACPGRAFGFSIRTGPNALDVVASGEWELVVDQQLDAPIAEPPLAGMSATARQATGEFYGIDQDGQGTVTLYRLPDGRRALRFDPFFVTQNTDLFVWLSAAREPTTSKDAFTSEHTQIAALKSTAGPQNYVVPDGVPDDQLRSVVVWCEPVRTAYAAASLAR
ncbi:MAG: DM13 domain-containing protein [Actinomycetota bacterium]|nr:DM13 domain-containing protein [Actinomycetota bacterium]